MIPLAITVVVTLAVLGFLTYLAALLPIDGTVKQIIRAVLIFLAVAFVAVAVLNACGYSTGLSIR